MDHIVNNPSLDHIDVAILCWASENSPFTHISLIDRFPELTPESICGTWLRSLTEQFYLSKEVDSMDTSYYSYIPPPEDTNVPPLFKEFCHNYSAAGGRVKSAQTCFEKFKQKTKNKWKSTIKLLGPAFDAQIAERERKRTQGRFVPELRNLLTWINERGWEDLISGDEMAAAPKSNEMSIYVSWVKSTYGATATAPLTEEQYLAYINGQGSFSGIKTKLSRSERQYLFETSHRSYFGGMTGKDSCYEYLVKLYQTKSL